MPILEQPAKIAAHRLTDERKAKRSERLWMVGIYSILILAVVGALATLAVAALDSI
ncbi:MAG: hypothetical protein ISN28_10080 [Ectothiorhodospiraceae bacterium AqS1]|nr:hypothetical protein [Ectothiorhodospiraceae bacterium AqS1]